MRARKLASKAVVSLCALAAALAFSSVPAGAEVTHKYLSSITEVPTEGPKGEPIALPGSLTEVNAMTIDGSDLYVAEHVPASNKSRIDVFDTAARTFVEQFDQPGAPAEEAYVGIAAGHATGSA